MFAPGQQSTIFLEPINHRVQLTLAEQTLDRSETNAIVRCEEIKIGGAQDGWRHTHQPACDARTVSLDEGVNEQWGKCKVINTVRFVSLTKVCKVFNVRNVGFGDDDGIRLHPLYERAQQSHQVMSLG